ncbi:hypothetical protein ACFSSF_10615 [Dietzia aerolata]|uniref:hypothetical protein n=1 Tax=Dietzia aerolata TaxID=595984 RepID=UPI003624B399
MLASDLRDSSDTFSELEDALQRAAETGDMSEITEIIGSDPSKFAAELASPVALNTIPVFKVDNFGSQMAPLYTVLGLWVGALLLSVLIRTEIDRDSLPPSARSLKPWQEYFGRYPIFGGLALMQSTILFVGLIGFVGVRPAHPFLLILAGWVMSFVFSLITYTLVLTLGEAGKAVGVLLLVVQISAGGERIRCRCCRSGSRTSVRSSPCPTRPQRCVRLSAESTTPTTGRHWAGCCCSQCRSCSSDWFSAGVSGSSTTISTRRWRAPSS